MHMTDRGLLALVRHEGLVPGPYLDVKKVWTFGIGHTGAAGPPEPARMPRGMPADLETGIREAFRLFRADLAAYPDLWGHTATDTNIDHRRVPNIETFLHRMGASRPASTRASDYMPGDLVTWRLTGGLPHIGIVSDRQSRDGTPLVVHNIGRGAQEEDVLFTWTITGHYRPDLASAAPPARALRVRISPSTAP